MAKLNISFLLSISAIIVYSLYRWILIKIISALSKTIELQKKIDKIYPEIKKMF